MPQTEWLKQHSFLIVREARSPWSGCQHGWVLVRVPFLVHGEPSTHCILTWQRERKKGLDRFVFLEGHPFYRGSPTPTTKCGSVSRSVVSNSATPQAEARQAPLSMRFPRQEYWKGLPFPSPGKESNQDLLLHCRWILYQLNHQGTPTLMTSPLLKPSTS